MTRDVVYSPLALELRMEDTMHCTLSLVGTIGMGTLHPSYAAASSILHLQLVVLMTLQVHHSLLVVYSSLQATQHTPGYGVLIAVVT